MNLDREQALAAYIAVHLKLADIGNERAKLEDEFDRLSRETRELKAIIFAEQIKPQREPRKGGYQPKGRSKEIVAQVLADNPSWLTNRQIREICNLSTDQVTEALRQLIFERFVVRSGTQGKHTYHLTVGRTNEQNENTHGDSIAKLSDVPGFPNSGS